jgi:hypothetical protein
MLASGRCFVGRERPVGDDLFAIGGAARLLRREQQRLEGRVRHFDANAELVVHIVGGQRVGLRPRYLRHDIGIVLRDFGLAEVTWCQEGVGDGDLLRDRDLDRDGVGALAAVADSEREHLARVGDAGPAHGNVRERGGREKNSCATERYDRTYL